MAQANTLENDMPEVYTRTVKYLNNETCDKCGSTVRASYEAKKEDIVLHFCGHHIRDYAETLKAQGFSVFPEDISYEAGRVPEDLPAE